MDNEKLREQLIELFTDFKLLEDHSFKTRVYERIIEILKQHEGTINGFNFSIHDGVGNSVQSKIFEFIKTGKCRKLDQLKKETAEEYKDPEFLQHLKDLCKIPGVGKKTAKDFISKGIYTVQDIKQAVEKGKLSKTWEKRLDVVFQTRIKWSIANKTSEKIIKALKDSGLKGRILSCGSLRRKAETVKDIDIVVEMVKGSDLKKIKDVVKEIEVSSLTFGDKWIRFIMDGIEVDLRITLPESFGAMIAHFTGPKDWNILLRTIGNKRDILINEYGIYKRSTGEKLGGKDEEDIFKILDIKYYPPEERIPEKIIKLF